MGIHGIRTRAWLPAVMFAFAVSYTLFLLSRFQLVMWDEAVYLGMGKYIYSGGSIGLWESIRPPFLPSLLGLLWKAGMDYVVSSKILMMLFSMGTAYVSYLVAKRIDKVTAPWAAFLVLFTPVLFAGSLEVMTEVPGAFFAVLSIYLFMRDHHALSGCAAFISFLTKYYNGLIFAAVCCWIAYDLVINHRAIGKRWRFAAVFLTLAAVLLAVNHTVYGSALDPLIRAGIHQDNPVHAVKGPMHNLLFYPLAIAGAPLLFLCIFAGWNRKTIPIALVISAYLAYLIYIPNKQERFASSFIPFLTILASAGISRIAKRFPEKWRIPLLGIAVLAIMPMLYLDVSSVLAFPKEKPPIVTEFHEYPYKGLILTMDPVPAAYSDARFMHYYNDVDDALAIYTAESYDMLIYNPWALYCADQVCESKKAAIGARIMNENKLLLNRTSDGLEKYILVPVQHSGTAPGTSMQ
jgi:4-amino-4-deoxy-L-arabinose transferase-like glycosyltransferase